MEFRQVKYFVAVAEDLNVSKAAKRRNTSQPSLGRQIQRLEEVIGVPLFLRKNRRLSLTEAGKCFLEKSRKILSDVDDAVLKTKAISTCKGRGIVIGYIPAAATKIFPLFFPYLYRKHPDIYPILKNTSSEDQVVALKSECIDVAFLRNGVEDDEIEKEVILYEKLVVLLPRAHPLANKAALTLMELSALPFIDVSKPLMMQIEHILGPLNFNSVRTSGLGERDSLFDQLSLIGSGMGFTIQTDFVREFTPASVVVRDLAIEPPPWTEMFVAYRKQGDSSTLAQFLAALRDWKRQLPAIRPPLNGNAPLVAHSQQFQANRKALQSSPVKRL